MGLITFDDNGIYCAQGQFYIDPWKPVDRAVITHGHSDHARWRHKHYLCTHDSVPVLKLRLGQDINVQGVAYGQNVYQNGVKISLHGAGHIIGSAQVRVEYMDEVWVVTGDYKTEDDGFSGAFELLPCHHLITECTFGLPIYHWEPQAKVFDQINAWWASNRDLNRVSVLAGYSLGKAQRLIQGVDESIGPIYTHGAIENTNQALRNAGIHVKPSQYVTPETKFEDLKGSLVVAPPGALATTWTKKFKNFSSAVASGWMAIRGNRRRRGVDRGFVLSDHIDWPALNEVVEASNPEHVYATHGFTETVVKWFQSKGRQASVAKTLYVGEGEENEIEV